MVVYIAINKINGKVYIGQTTQPFNLRKIDHKRKAQLYSSKSHFHAAIRKYGFDAFSWKVLETVLFREALNKAERYWIRFYKSTDPKRGYNNTTGGDSFELTTDAKNKLSKSLMGQNNPNFGKPKSPETKARMSASQKGRKQSPSHTEKSRLARIGRHLSEEHKQHIRLAHLGKKHDPVAMEKTRLFNLGSKRTPEQKARMSAAAKRRWSNAS